MTKISKELSLEGKLYSKEEFAEYTALVERYFLETGREFPNRLLDEQKYLTFFAGIQAKVQKELCQQFQRHGYHLVRICPSTFNQPAGMYYKIMYAKNVFGFRLTDQYLCLSEIIQDVYTNTVESGESFPDVRVLNLSYLQAKIMGIAEKEYAKFAKKLLNN